MKKITLFIALLSFVMSIVAIPARRTPFVVKQSDGTELTVFLTGDEAFHYYSTLDGVPLVREANGDFFYARLTADGSLVTTKHLAHEPEIRTTEELNLIEAAKASGMRQEMAKVAARRSEVYNAPRRSAQTIRPEGQINVPVLLVEFSDYKFTFTKEDFALSFNGENYNGPKNPFTSETPGSLRDYFVSQSDGKFIPNFVVTDIITLDRPMEYYGGNDSKGDDKNPQQMIIDACKAADANMDFSIFDNDGDGLIEFVYCLYAGYSEASGAPEETIWPHQWYLSALSGTITVDGVKVDNYACSSELSLNASYESRYGVNMSGIGSCCHEFSHCLGLPDFYDTSGSDNPSFGMDYWDLMDYGCYNVEGYVPIGYSAYERDFMGWRELALLTENGDYSMEALTSGGHGYKIVNEANPDEYYVLENRQQEGWDKYIFNSGLLITHVDYSQHHWYYNTVNNDKEHQRFTLIPADGKLLTYSEASTSSAYTASLKGDVWPGTSGNTALTDSSNPAAKVYKGGYMGKPITNIKNENGIVSFRFSSGTLDVPLVQEATAVTSTSFTANWTKQKGAWEYKVILEKMDESMSGSIETILMEDFTKVNTEGMNASFIINSYTTAAGWTAEKVYTATGAMRIGEAAKGGFLKTPTVTTQGDTELQFRIKTVESDDTGAGIRVIVRGEDGTVVKSVEYTATSSFVNHTLEIGNIGEFNVEFTTLSVGSCMRVLIDDIKVTTEVEYAFVHVDTVVTTDNWYTFTNLESGATYRYGVKASDGARDTEISDYVTVNLLETGIDEVAVDSSDAHEEIYDISGRRVSNPTSGVYIIRKGDKVKKIVIK